MFALNCGYMVQEVSDLSSHQYLLFRFVLFCFDFLRPVKVLYPILAPLMVFGRGSHSFSRGPSNKVKHLMLMVLARRGG